MPSFANQTPKILFQFRHACIQSIISRPGSNTTDHHGNSMATPPTASACAMVQLKQSAGHLTELKSEQIGERSRCGAFMIRVACLRRG
jgi:hypothetical protein